MSLRKNIFTLLTVGIATIAFSTFSFAQDTSTSTSTDKSAGAAQNGREGRRLGGRGGKQGFEGRRGFGRRGGFGGGIGELRGLNLTDAQREQIKTIMQSNKPDKANFEALRTTMEARRNGGTLTDAQKAQIKQLREQQVSKRKAVHDQIMNVLTAEQKAQLEQKKTERKERREQFMKNRDQFRQKRQEFRKDRLKGKPAAPATDKPKTITE
jgi:protein CpxP